MSEPRVLRPEAAPLGTGPAVPAESGDPLAEAEALRDLLQEAQARLGRLLTALKLHRRQSRALQAAMASLRELPTFLP